MTAGVAMPSDTALIAPLPVPVSIPSPRADNPVRRGVGWMMLCLFLFALMDVLQKELVAHYPAMEVMFFRSLFSLVPLAVVLVRTGGWGALATRRPCGHLLRSIVGALSVAGFIHAFGGLPFADVYAISFAGPLFVTALSAPLLGEAVRARQWVAVGVGFLGVLVMLNPGAGLLSGTALLCVAATSFGALASICVRRLSRTETNVSIVFYFTLACGVLGGVGMIPDFVMPDARGLALMAGAGLLSTVAQLAMTQAYRLAPAAVVAPFSYSSMLWAVMFGALLFGEMPGLATLVGTVIVMGSGLYLLQGGSLQGGGARA